MTPEPVAPQEAPKQVQAIPEKSDTRKPEAEERDRTRRYAERKAKREAEALAQQRREQRQLRGQEGARIMAFGGDSSPGFSGEFFGN